MATTKEILVHDRLTEATEFDHSAQEIDDAVSKVEGGASALGCAPAGYGEGGQSKLLTSADDLNTIWKNGSYYWKSDAPANAPVLIENNKYCFMRVTNFDSDDFVQEIRTLNDNSKTKLVRISRSGSIVEEWENPPMQLGVEYRTTERYLGKPVYVKAVSVGELVANTEKNVVLLSAGGDNFVRAYALGDDPNGHRVCTPRANGDTFYCYGVLYAKTAVRPFLKSSRNLTNVAVTGYYTKASD